MGWVIFLKTRGGPVSVIAKRLLFIGIVVALSSVGAVYAQTTAVPTVLGFLATTGCPGTQHYCWVPYSAANPMPVTLTITSP